jgi:hypothetical protein
MKNISLIFLAIIVSGIFLSSSESSAQGCCSSGAPLLGSMELGTTKAGFWQLALSYRFNTLDDLYLGTQAIDKNFRQRRTRSVATEINYGLGKGFTANALLTFVQQERTIQPIFTGGSEDFVQLRGLSDIILLLKYSLLTPNIISQREISLGVGTKFATGTHDKTRNNILVSYDLQPGTGATDAILWGYFSQGFQPRRYQLNAVASYRITGTNNLDYRFGNEFVGSMGVNYRINNHFNISNQVRYRHTTADKFLSYDIPNTGGKWLYLVPGINLPLGNEITLRSSVEIPIYRDLSGIQLTTSYAFSFSAFYSFDLKLF